MLKDLEKTLHTQIPMTKLMQLQVESLDKKELITTMPLDVNINDKGSAFGGSSNALTIISGWSVCILLSKEMGLGDTMIAIIKNQSSFRAPITKDFICHTYLPSEEQISKMKEKILSKKSITLKLRSEVIQDSKICLDFEGMYIIKLK